MMRKYLRGCTQSVAYRLLFSVGVLFGGYDRLLLAAGPFHSAPSQPTPALISPSRVLLTILSLFLLRLLLQRLHTLSLFDCLL